MTSGGEFTLEQLMSGNQNAYTNLWRKYCDLPLQKVSAQMGASLLKTAGLNETTLRDIWELSDYSKTGSLDQKGFFLALHLVALAQNGMAATLQNISQQTPAPRFTDLSDNMQPSEWEEAEKKFNDLPHQDGFLSGNSVKPMMLASGLPPQILARIWQMVDTDADGKLRVNEFCVALFLISQCSAGQLLPQNIPSSLFIRPSTLSTGPPVGAKQPDVFTLSASSKKKYHDTFFQYTKGNDMISGHEAREVFKMSKLPVATLAEVWNLCSKRKPGFLTVEEFSLAMLLIEGRMQGKEIPASISQDFRLVSAKGATPLPSLPSVLSGPLDYSCIKELDGFENEVKSMDQQVDTLRQEVITTQAAVTQKTAEMSEVQAKLSSANDQRVHLEKMRSELSSQLEDVDRNQVTISRSLVEVQERCRVEEEEIKGLERELLERETTFKVKQEQLGEMRRHISSLKEQQDEMERQVEERKERIAEINQSTEDAQKELVREHAKLKTLQEEESSLSSQMKHLVILEAQTKDSELKIVNLGDTDTLPVDYISKEGDVNSIRATAGSSPVSSISNASSAPQMEDNQIEDVTRLRDNGILKGVGGSSDRTVKFSDEVDQTHRPDPQGAPSGLDLFNADPFLETTANPATDPFLIMDPFGSGAQTQNSGGFDPFLSTEKASFPGGVNPFLSFDVLPKTQEGANFGTDPFAQAKTNDPFQQDANTDPFGSNKTGFDATDPFGTPADDPFKSSAFNPDLDPFNTDPFAGTQESDPFETDPFTT